MKKHLFLLPALFLNLACGDDSEHASSSRLSANLCSADYLNAYNKVAEAARASVNPQKRSELKALCRAFRANYGDIRCIASPKKRRPLEDAHKMVSASDLAPTCDFAERY